MANNLKQLSLDQIRKIVKKEEKALKKEYSEWEEKKKLIERYKKIRKANLNHSKSTLMSVLKTEKYQKIPHLILEKL